MIGFAARRLASMLLVMFALSVLVFLIFNAIPNGDPAQRIAGDRGERDHRWKWSGASGASTSRSPSNT